MLLRRLGRLGSFLQARLGSCHSSCQLGALRAPDPFLQQPQLRPLDVQLPRQPARPLDGQHQHRAPLHVLSCAKLLT